MKAYESSSTNACSCQSPSRLNIKYSLAYVYNSRRKSDMSLKKFLSRIIGYTPESQDTSHIGVKPGAVIQSNQALQTTEIPKVVQEVSGQFDAMWRLPSIKAVEPALKEELKVEEVPKATIETKPAEVAPQPVPEPIKAVSSSSMSSSRARTSVERATPRPKVNVTNTLNSARASPKPGRKRKATPKEGMATPLTKPRQIETTLDGKEKQKKKMAATMLQGS